MPAIKTVKIRAYTNRAGYARVDDVLGLLQKLYNAGLEERRTAYRQAGNSLTLRTQQLQLKDICQDLPEYAALDRHLLSSTLRRLDKSFRAFFRRVKTGEKPGYPRFKGRGRFNSVTDLPIAHKPAWYHRNGQDLAITIKGLPKLTAKLGSLDIPDTLPNSLGIIRRGKRIWLTLTYEFEPEPLPFTGGVLGLDRGINKVLADSNGATIPPFKRNHKGRRKLQRKMARRMPKPGQKGSRSYRKAKTAHARFLERESTAKRQAIHQITTRLIRKNDVIVLESLNVKGMTRTAKGTAGNPGKNVKAKAGLNREILTQSWGEIRQQLSYKAEWAGKRVIEVDPRFTSQTCQNCGSVDGKNRRGQQFRCLACGFETDADHNAAVNILRRGLTTLGLNHCPTGARDVAITPSGDVGYQHTFALESPG